MNTIELDGLLRANEWTQKYYKDTLPLDLFLRQRIVFPSLFIVNTDPSDKPGMHWLVVFFLNRRYAELFDSYGLRPAHFYPDVYTKMKSHCDEIVFHELCCKI